MAAFLGSSPTCIAILLLSYKQKKKSVIRRKTRGRCENIDTKHDGRVLRKLVEDHEIGATTDNDSQDNQNLEDWE